MPFEARVVDVSVYQGTIDWAQVKAAGIYAAVIRAGYGRYAKQEDLRFAENYADAQAAGLPVGVYWFSYAHTPEEAVLEAQICLQVLAGRGLQMPLYFDQEENDIPTANRTACAVAFLDYIRANSPYMPGYYSYTAYFASVDIPTIQAHADTIWLADYRANYNKDIPRDMHQYTSSGTVAGITGRVDCNNLFRDFPRELSDKEDKPMYTSDTLRIGPASAGDLKTLTALAESLAVTVLQEGDCLIIGPMSAGDITTISGRALALGLPCEDYATPAQEPEQPDAPAEEPTTDDGDLMAALAEALAALGRIEAAQTALGTRLTELHAGIELLQDKLTAAGAALVGE